MSSPTDRDTETRAAMRDQYRLIDLGRMPEHIREIAYQWGGTVPGGIAVYQVASTDGLIRDPDELRREIAGIPSVEDRDALAAWLADAAAGHAASDPPES